MVFLKIKCKNEILYFCSNNYYFDVISRNKSDFEYLNDPRSYPMSCWIPFTVENYLTFVALWVMQIFVLFTIINIYLIIDTYMFGAIYIIGTQFDLLGDMFVDIEHSSEFGVYIILLVDSIHRGGVGGLENKKFPNGLDKLLAWWPHQL